MGCAASSPAAAQGKKNGRGRGGGNRVHPASAADLAAHSPPLSLAELDQHRTAGGALTLSLAELRLAASARGLAPGPGADSPRPEVWPLLLGLWAADVTAAERERAVQELHVEYEALRKAGEVLRSDPAFKDGVVVGHDVHRTHPTHPLYESCKVHMSEILFAYAAHNPQVGYSQGMSDMLAVLLFELQDAPLAFGCFRALMAGERGANPGLAHGDLLRLHRADSVSEAGDRVLARLYQILQRRLPKLHRHLSAIPGSAMIFYPWVKLLLKRQLKFEEVGRLWEGCWGAPVVAPAAGAACPAADMLLYCCAALLETRQQSVLKCKLDMAALMDCLRGIEAPAEVLLSRAVELAKQDKVLPG